MSELKNKGIIFSINISKNKGELKNPVEVAEMVAGMGIKGDGHFGFKPRQVSLLMLEAIEQAKKELKKISPQKAELISPGSFAENITTKGIDLLNLKPGDLLVINKSIRLKVSQIGKEDHADSIVNRTFGISLLPKIGIFCEVLNSGTIKVGDEIEKS